jgi:uncharacterized membrane protein YvlD (DUF360 family)
LIVFFANYILPGIEIVNHTKLPQLAGDIPFAIALGLLNSLIYPVLKSLHRETSVLSIAVVALILNLAAYAILKFFTSIGIEVRTIEGYLVVSLVVAVGSFLTNFLEMKHYQHHHKPHVSKVEPE